MKILNVNALLDPTKGGGTVERTIQMSRYLSFNKDIEVSILTLNIGVISQSIKSSTLINLIIIPCLNKRFYLPFFLSRKISKSIKESDVIHLMGHWSLINLVAYFWIQKYKKPYVVCPAGALPIFGRSKLLKELYNKFGGQACIRNANVNIAVSKDEFFHFSKYGVDSKKIILLPNGVDPEAYTYKNDAKLRQQFLIGDSPFILFVGRLNLIKGPDLLLKAFSIIEKKYSDYLLIFAGLDDGMELTLRNSVKKYNLNKKVRFIGFVEGSVKSELYHAADLLVIPSRQEAMSIVILESALTGTPVMMTNTCGLNEMTGKHGAYEVSPDSKSIAEGLNLLLSDKKGLDLRGLLLKEYIEVNFSWNVLVKRYLDVYKKLL